MIIIKVKQTADDRSAKSYREPPTYVLITQRIPEQNTRQLLGLRGPHRMQILTEFLKPSLVWIIISILLRRSLELSKNLKMQENS